MLTSKIIMLKQKFVVYILGLFSVILYFYIHFDIEKWIYTKCKKYVDYIYHLLCKHDSLGFFIIVSILVVLFIHCLTIKKDSYFSTKRYFSVVFGCIVWFLSLECWSYNILYGWFRIDVFISFVLIIYLGLLIYRSIYYEVSLKHRLVGAGEKTVFNIDKNRKEYAEAILRHIKESVHDESYAVGLAARWGSGKSCFLANLEQELYKDGQLIFSFNAWNSKTPDNIIVDFFNGLSDLLSPFYSNLQRPLLKYAELLTAIDAHSSIVYFINKIEHTTVGSLRFEIIEALQSINKPVYILIDDVDRLTKEEVLEVLRLIRNTGNFPYLKYIVAYDKDYVEHRLEDLNIPPSYLNKIFSIELSLPLLTEHIEGNIIKDVLRRNILQKKHFDVLSSYVDSLQNKYTLFFSDFRQVERFAQQCALNVGFILYSHRNINLDYHLGDFFFIELLKFSDRKTYEILQSNPELLLTANTNVETHTSEYVFDKKSGKEAISEVKNGTLFLLEKLFSESIHFQKKRTCMSFLESYDQYFSYGISENKVSVGMFGHFMLDSTSFSELEEKVKGNLNNNKFVESLTHHFLCTVTSKMKVNLAKRYFDLCLILLENTDKLNDWVGEKMQEDSYDSEVVSDLSSYILQRLNFYINDSSYHLAVAKFLVQYLSYFDDDCIKSGVYIASNDILLSIIRQNAINYLEANSFDAADIIRSGSLLNQFVKYHIIHKEVEPYPLDESDVSAVFNNLIIDELITFFSHHQSIDLKAVDEWASVDPATPNEYYGFEKTSIDIDIISLFESIENFEKYKAECFK